MRIFAALFFLNLTLFGVGFLMPEEAFKPRIAQIDPKTVGIEIDLGDQIYLYADKIKVEDSDPKDGIDFKTVTMTAKAADHEGEKVYEVSPAIRIELGADQAISGKQKIGVKLSFQGCSSAGLCYEPQETTLSLTVDGSQIPAATTAEKSSVIQAPAIDLTQAVSKSSSEPETGNPGEAVLADENGSETDQIAGVIKGGSLWFIIITFFGFGLLLSLTPCVFPMIPIISSVIVAQGEGIGTKRAFWLSMAYVLAMAVAYTIAGILAGLFGSNLQAALQTPWIITLFALIFFFLSLSMFDLYELQVPNFIQSRISQLSGRKGGILGVVIMGFLSALIVGPCVAAPLAGALIYIGQTGDALLGGVALFALSIGMGLPLIAVGTTAGKFMPKPGAWMDTIKAAFGVMMIAVAIWMLSRILDENIILMLWGALTVFVAINIGALDSIVEARAWSTALNQKALGLIILLYGVLLLVGGMAGAKSLLHPMDPFLSAGKGAVAVTRQAEHAPFEKITSIEELDAILAENKGKKVMVDFYADWCTSCKEFEEKTFSDITIKSAMDRFVLVQVDVTANDDASNAITKKYGIFGPPAILFFDENGSEIKNGAIVGFKEPQEFLEHLEKINKQ